MMKRSLVLTVVLTFIAIASYGQGDIENLMIHWPEEYEWKVGSNQEGASVHFIELVPGKEDISDWSIIGTMMSIKGAKNIPMDVAMDLMYQEALKNAPKAKLTLIEKYEEGKNHWVIFKIEAKEFKNDEVPESQLYYPRELIIVF
jgi:hypothetical protein